MQTDTPTRTGYTFQGWGTSKTATKATYQPGGSLTISEDTTLYAVWKANTYTITYNANGGSGAPDAQTGEYGKTSTLSTGKPTRTGYTFQGWATSKTATKAAYQPGGSLTVSGDTTLYALWQEKTQVVYRLYQSANGEHLYTTDVNEVRQLAKNYGWQYEGSAWVAPTTGTAVYRLYNASLGNHLYTTDTNEVDTLTSKHGWQKDYGGKPLFYSGGSVVIYRLYNEGLSGMHLWTTDKNEYTTLKKYSWTQEGISFYALEKGNSKLELP